MPCNHQYEEETHRLQTCNGCGLTKSEAAMVDALQFYADPSTYKPVFAQMGAMPQVAVKPITGDMGTIARLALGIEQEVDGLAREKEVAMLKTMPVGTLALPGLQHNSGRKGSAMPLKIKLLRKGAQIPVRANPHDSGLDLFVLEDTFLPILKPVMIPHGIAIEAPLGFESQIRPRSSTMLKRGIHCALGTIDNSFRGEIASVVVLLGDPRFPVRMDGIPLGDYVDADKSPTGTPGVWIRGGDRLTQLVVVPVAYPEAVVVDDLEASQRGASGWGSTGM